MIKQSLHIARTFVAVVCVSAPEHLLIDLESKMSPIALIASTALLAHLTAADGAAGRGHPIITGRLWPNYAVRLRATIELGQPRLLVTRRERIRYAS